MAERKRKLDIDPEEVVGSVLKNLENDLQGRSQWMDMRLARYAKYRGWLPDKSWPWDNASNAHIPVMFIHSQQIQDTLHNAVMAIRPPIRAVAIKRKDAAKQEAASQLIDYQVFVEQKGEEMVGHLIEKFVNDGLFIVYVPWVRETRMVHDFRTFPALDPLLDRRSQLENIVSEILFQEETEISGDEEGTKWTISLKSRDGKKRAGTVTFEDLEGGDIEAEIRKPVDVYDGPVPIIKNIEDVVFPWRTGNLQPQGPHNPHGCPHVFLLDYPLIDEIKRLKKAGFYDLIKDEDMEKIETSEGRIQEGEQTEDPKRQKDIIEGVDAQVPGTTKKPLTRILAFDRKDVDGDGLEEDVMLWILKEPKLLLRARLMSEMFPSVPPTRPLVGKPLIPVGPDRLYGISLLEITEPLHDQIVTAYNQINDNGTLTNTPFGFYRPGSGMKGEIIRLWPGEMYPLGDPQRDTYFPNIGNQSQALFFNMIATTQQYLERATMQGELSFGRVPKGQASTLRNVASLMAVLRQGDARPERILRRLFSGVAEIWSIIHSLNQRFLPPEKEILISGLRPEAERYLTVKNEEIRGDFTFDFQASVLNTSPEAVQQALVSLGSALFSPLSWQLGTATQDNYYQWLRDLVKTAKLDPELYVTRPTPEAGMQKLLAEEFISAILEGSLPDAIPLEDPKTHLMKLLAFTNDDTMFGLLSEGTIGLFRAHFERVKAIFAQQQRAAQIASAAAQLQSLLGQGGGGEVGTIPPGMGPQISGGGELLDESLPGAGGGANAGLQ